MEPSSTPTKPGAVAAAGDHAAFDNESSPATAAQPTVAPTRPAVPRNVMIGALLAAAILPAILVAMLFTILIASSYNIMNWME